MGRLANTRFAPICPTDHARKAFAAWQQFIEAQGPIAVGAAQGASCFGPGYEFCKIMETELRRRKIRVKAPITFVTYEPYIGHLGLGGVGFAAIPQISPRNVNWSSRGRHIHLGKIAFEKYFLYKVRTGVSEPFYEKYILKRIGIDKVKSKIVAGKSSIGGYLFFRSTLHRCFFHQRRHRCRILRYPDKDF